MKGQPNATHFDFDVLYDRLVVPHFDQFDQRDSRFANASHSVSDACKSGFTVYSLESDSLLDFRPKAPAELANLKTYFRIDKIPSDNGLRNILDGVDAAAMVTVFGSVVDYFEAQGVLTRYRYFQDALVVIVDSVHHYSSEKVRCHNCLDRHHHDGRLTYSHSLLSAVVVDPRRAEVFICDNEPIVQQDGAVKNYCERTAAGRLLRRLGERHSTKSMIYVMDALYGCAPIIAQLGQCSPRWKYVINCKEGSHKHMFAQFDEANERGRSSGVSCDVRRQRMRWATSLTWRSTRPTRGEDQPGLHQGKRQRG